MAEHSPFYLETFSSKFAFRVVEQETHPRKDAMQEGDGDLPGLLANDLTKYFQQLVQVYQYRLYTFILRQTDNAQDAEDIVQETFMRAYFALKAYLPERIRSLIIRPWLYKIALNVFYSRTRKTTSSSVPLDLSEDGPHLSMEEDDRWQPEALLQERETLQEIAFLVSCLPSQYRTVVNCYYFEHLSYQEIAELLNMPMGTVKTNLFRGTRLLRKTLETHWNEV